MSKQRLSSCSEKREKTKQNPSVEENEAFPTCLSASYFSYTMENKQDQLSINNFPGLFPFSPKPARGIIISAMVYMCVMVFMNPVCKLTEASV